ncbi:hypothetical protein V6N13_049632 [Hibiscus sabdariffa]
MYCFSCCMSEEKVSSRRTSSEDDPRTLKAMPTFANISFKSDESRKRYITEEIVKRGNGNNISAKVFNYCDLCTATNNFNPENQLGQGGFGRVYKGQVEDPNQIVAVKQLDRNGYQGNREFLVEVLMLSLLNHPNLMTLVGYCADGDQRILVYEYMPNGSLDSHLLDLPSHKKALDWDTRIKVAIGAAKGLEYLHETVDPPAVPLFKDKSKFQQMVDPLLQGNYPNKGLHQALAVAAMCLQDDATARPVMSDVVTALEYIITGKGPKGEEDIDDEEQGEKEE